MRVISFIFILFLVIFGITFSVLNAETVTLHYYIGVQKFPLSFIMAIAFSIGLLIGFFMMSVVVLRLKADRHRLKARLEIVEQEIENLRTMPIKNDH